MPKKFLKKYLPNPETLQQNKDLKFLSRWIAHPALWHLTRKSTSRAFLIGLIAAWIPIPFQMVLAATLAVIFSANLPIATALVWITNPVTMPIMFYGAYLFGAHILQHHPVNVEFHLSWHWISESLHIIGYPFLLGCISLGLISGLSSYLIIQLIWRYSIVKRWRKRKHRSKSNNS